MPELGEVGGCGMGGFGDAGMWATAFALGPW